MTDKITVLHLPRTAYVDIRQSSMGQVLHHRESTKRQYSLRETARSFGWLPSRIKTLDGDLGRSGSSTTDRTDFRTLVADVSLGNAGAVLALEASRLARSNADWHRLIEICGITGILEDGEVRSRIARMPRDEWLVEKRVWEVVNEEHLNLALDAYDILREREQQIGAQWKLRLQRADYEAQLARKRYEQVDPENRLVASTLEQRWNDALIELEDVKNQIAELRKKENIITSHEWEEVLKLAEDLPRLWKCHTTSSKDKKRILQLLIPDITVQKPERGRVIMHVRWQGGQCEELDVRLPRPAAERWCRDDALVQRVRELAQDCSDEEIAAKLNAEVLQSNKGNAFTRSSISWIRHKHRLPPVDKRKPEERTVHDVARQFGVSHGVVYYWIANKIITARRLNRRSPYWITISQRKEKELEKCVRESNRIHPR
jgi:hypothetical protein